jgi:hypothetical protein
MNEALFSYYDQPLQGNHLPSNRLNELINSNRIVIIHFLRHLGCLFCKHTVDEFYRFRQENPSFPPVYFVHQSSTEIGEKFFGQHYPGAAHISDTSLNLYHLFHIKRAKPANLLNPFMLWKGMQLTLKGYRNKSGFGDELLLSGTFLFLDGKLVWSHLAKNPGDVIDWKKLPA